MSRSALTVLMMRSKEPLAARSAPSSFVAMCVLAPRSFASCALASERLIVVTSAPIAAAIFTAMCPRPPTPTTATRRPGPAPQRLSGTYVVIPAHSSGAATSSSIASGTRTTMLSLTTTCWA